MVPARRHRCVLLPAFDKLFNIQWETIIIMSPFDVLTLLGGLAMFLYGMRLMGDGLKQSSSGTLKVVMEM